MYFDPAADVKMLYDALDTAINHIENQAEHGTKFFINEPHYLQSQQITSFFYNSVILADNTIFVDHRSAPKGIYKLWCLKLSNNQ
jgi:hypothetical protein